MVTNTRATPCPSGIQPLDEPRPVQVETGAADKPAAIGSTRNRNVRALGHRPSKSSERTTDNLLTPFAVQRARHGERTFSYKWQQIIEVLDSWRIDDEWWRKQPVSRLYYRVVLEDGTMTGLFKDLISGKWFLQRV